MLARFFSLAAMTAVSLGSAEAAEFHHSEPRFVPVHNCTCRFEGQEIALGQRRCLRTPDGPRAAECVMEQNVTSWRFGKDPCPEASTRMPERRTAAVSLRDE